MKTRNFFFALTLIALSLNLISCTKEAISEPITVADPLPSIPSGDRIIIHFGTSTQNGCIYSFTNCIWIGWGTETTNFADRFAMRFDKGDEAGQYFGNYFPLTADYTLDATTAATMGLPPQVIPAGFYPLSDTPIGKMVVFSPESAQHVAPLVNPGNPQDNLGQLHNLALQVILSAENQDAIRQIKGDKAAIQRFAIEKTAEFLEASGLPVNPDELQRAKSLNLFQNYSDFEGRIDATRLSAGDKKVLRSVFNQAAAIPVSSPEQLSHFVSVMSELENGLAQSKDLTDARRVLSIVSVLKYSRYYWYWKSYSSGGGSGTAEPASIPNWVWADAIGMELGGPLVSAAVSIAVYLDEH
ncbi:MAG: hypothetical protein IPL27_26075 [Lewinellaceae bacterium]|nr:hypothetical protein [Lewinellaceae bacterium]